MKNRMDDYTCWVMPFEVFLYAQWYKVVGFGVFQMRFATILFGALVLCGWFSRFSRSCPPIRDRIWTTTPFAASAPDSFRRHKP